MRHSTKSQRKPHDDNEVIKCNLNGAGERCFTVSRRDTPSISVTFNFTDDKWYLLDLLKPYQADFDAIITFSSVAEWLRYDAKLYIAHLWLETHAGALQILQTMSSIRELGRLFAGFKGRPVELNIQHANEFVRYYCALDRAPTSNKGARRRINGFMAFVRHLYPEGKTNNFKLIFPISKTAGTGPLPLEQAQEKRIPTNILSKIIDACTADLNAYYAAKERYIDQQENAEKCREYQRRYYHERRKGLEAGTFQKLGYTPRIVQLLSKAIRAQATILAVCVGRRVAAICNTKLNIRTERVEWTNECGQKEKVVLVRFREMKVRNVDEDVACPDAFGELAINAINTAKELTSELRANNPQWGEYLFLVPTRIPRKGARVLQVRQLNSYLNGQRDGHLGICQRYNISSQRITTHNFRATRATNVWMGGLQVHEVSYDLGHVNSDMTIRHYIVGRDEDRRRLQDCMDKGALSGAFEDMVAGREMVQMRLGRRHVEIMRKQGRVLSPTRYGYCSLPAASGPCPRTTPCYIGPAANGGGCDYHVLSPDALAALKEDRELLLTNIETFDIDPSYKIWVQHQRIQLKVIEEKIRETNTLQHCFNSNCPADGSCICAECNSSERV